MLTLNFPTVGFHERGLKAASPIAVAAGHWEPTRSYTFYNFFHPHVGDLAQKLNREGLAGMLDASWHKSLEKRFFEDFYSPDPENSKNVDVVSFLKGIDLGVGGPYANYNWELLFHVPFAIAVHLSKSQRFAEAQRWFHYIFDPTSNDESVSPPKRFWKFLAFRTDQIPQRVEQLLELMSTPDPSDELKALRGQLLAGYRAILDTPFQPHVVARTRTIAYQYAVVMKYLDNQIAWGDSLFQQDTIETINEATMHYVLAANILGPRPQSVPPRGTTAAKSFAQLRTKLDALSNALVDLEGQFPFNLMTATGGSGDSSAAAPLLGIGRSLYFCIPRNDQLLAYWDRVADRLFKIRHCMNIAGVVRPLALFDPPIDPGMLVKAAAAGIDVSGIVNGLNQPPTPVRALMLIQKASELASAIGALGSALLSAIEKGDAERLARVRQGHEIAIQKRTREVKFLQWKAAEEATNSLIRSRGAALERYKAYRRLLDLESEIPIEETITIQRPPLTEANFDEAFAKLVAAYDVAVARRAQGRLALVRGGAPSEQSGSAGTGRLYLNRNEDADLNVHPPAARDLRIMATVADGVTQALSLIPDMSLDLHYWGLGGHAKISGSSTFSAIGRAVVSGLNTAAAIHDSEGAGAAKAASLERRADDWILQFNLAAHELMQNGRQILTSLIAEQISRHEIDSLDRQIANSEEVDTLLKEKFSNTELYAWLQGEQSRLYYEHYRFACDTARKAERSMKRELMRPEVDQQDFIKFNYWDGGRKGLLAGEALLLDIKRMELAYHESNKRELELTRHISLRQLDPLALHRLRATGSCELDVPEWLFDRECPGHYMRRIKSVAVSVPAVVGPYASLNLTLSLLRSSLRISPDAGDNNYGRAAGSDDRFRDYAGAIQTIVTSGGSSDSGLFETNLRDERPLPFEGAGAISTWKIDLPRPTDFPAFDYTTISDVVLHMRYTARSGIEPGKAVADLKRRFATADQSGLALLLALPNDFPTAWATFVNGTAPFAASVGRDYFPYFATRAGKQIRVDRLELYGADPAKHQILPGTTPEQATTAIRSAAGQFEISCAPIADILPRTDGAQAFLLVQYGIV